MSFQFTDAARQSIDTLQPTDDAPPVRRGLGRDATRVHAGFTNIAHHQRKPRQRHIVANPQMPRDADTTADATARAEVRTAREPRTASDRRMRANRAVVPHLHEVVDLHALGDHRVVDGPAIDGGVGTYVVTLRQGRVTHTLLITKQ